MPPCDPAHLPEGLVIHHLRHLEHPLQTNPRPRGDSGNGIEVRKWERIAQPIGSRRPAPGRTSRGRPAAGSRQSRLRRARAPGPARWRAYGLPRCLRSWCGWTLGMAPSDGQPRVPPHSLRPPHPNRARHTRARWRLAGRRRSLPPGLTRGPARRTNRDLPLRGGHGRVHRPGPGAWTSTRGGPRPGRRQIVRAPERAHGHRQGAQAIGGRRQPRLRRGSVSQPPPQAIRRWAGRLG